MTTLWITLACWIVASVVVGLVMGQFLRRMNP